MEEKKNLMSYEKLRELEAERDERKEVIRAEIAQKIKEAREQGDLSENAEYDAAKDEQRENELRIEEIESILKNAEVYLEEDVAKDAVGLGSTVTLLDIEYNEEVVYKIVGSTEVDSLNGRISNESPVGKAIVGAKKGATITVDTPAGQIKYKILKVEKPAGAKSTKSPKKTEEKAPAKTAAKSATKTASKSSAAKTTTKKKADK
ncbi:MAG: transcription elongation factor GreA [Lachnospiraceae bacterium]|nr:transcription elongation factor GreA [Lachnospiraceae bacterium]